MRTAIHDLDRIQCQAREDRIEITRSARWYGMAVGRDADAILEVLYAARPEHFQKSMPATREPGVTQDVYRVPVDGDEFYLKVTDEGVFGARIVSLKWRRKLPG